MMMTHKDENKNPTIKNPGLTGSAAIFTCIFLLNLSQVSTEGQRCYVCGPRSYLWYSNGTPPPCGDFKPEPQFEVICGKGYNYCATIKTPGSQEMSRVCIETHEHRGCISKACAKTKTLFTVCSCDGALCNGEPSSATVTAETPTQGTTISEVWISLESTVAQEIGTSVKPDNFKNNEHENTILNDEEHINKTKISKSQGDVINNKKDARYLPSPEALEQEEKQYENGLPYDDEDIEGSGIDAKQLNNKSSKGKKKEDNALNLSSSTPNPVTLTTILPTKYAIEITENILAGSARHPADKSVGYSEDKSAVHGKDISTSNSVNVLAEKTAHEAVELSEHSLDLPSVHATQEIKGNSVDSSTVTTISTILSKSTPTPRPRPRRSSSTSIHRFSLSALLLIMFSQMTVL